ncbi:MAG: hypothetical protein HQL93_00930 [Magnetococcales bacterium]|nr:hypothetical protein [Magnetococcales bacterium]
MIPNNAQAVMSQVFNNAKSGTLTDDMLLSVLKLLLDAGNSALAHELLKVWHAGKRKA